MTLAARIAHWLHRGGDATFATVPPDGVPWQFEAPDGFVAVGDVQGDLAGLDAILRLCGLVDARGDWCGGQRHLVLAGDVVGGHVDARWCAAFVARLQAQAPQSGGVVHALIGNHDLLPARGEIDRWTAAERRGYRQPPVAGAPSSRAADAFRGDSELAIWLRRRNAIVRIGDTLFAHGGLGEWFPRTDPAAVNATVRAWIAMWQGRGSQPPAATRWAVGVPGMARESRFARGPVWTRAFPAAATRRVSGAPLRDQLAVWLRDRGAVHLCVGHAPVTGGGIQLEHPYYGELLTHLDTRIADRERGVLSALVVDANGRRTLQFAAECRDPACVDRERARATVAGPSPSRWRSAVARLLWLVGIGRQR